VICGAAIPMAAPGIPSLPTLHEQADNILQEWRQYMEDWTAVVQHQAAGKTTTKDKLIPLLMVRCGDVYCWNVEALCEHIDIQRWFQSRFPSIEALARVWLGRAPSNALQERVFSTGGPVMSDQRTRTDNHRAEMQVLLKHNRKEIRRMETDTGKVVCSTSGSTANSMLV
jgi:hypothetical protein